MNSILLFADLVMPGARTYIYRSIDINSILLTMGVCLLGTIIIEMIGALILKVRRKNLLVVLLAQIITNPLLVLVINYVNIVDKKLFQPTFLIAEAVAFIAEGILYKCFFRDYRTVHPFVLSLILNLLSLIIGGLMISYFGSLH